MRTILMVWAIVLILGLALAGCGHPELVVESNTEWAGWHNNEWGGVEYVEGIRGNKTFIGSDCGEFQIATKWGYIHARVEQKGIFNNKPEDAARAESAYANVRVCAGN